MRVREHVEGGVQAQALELFAELLDELVEQYLEALGEEGDGALYDSFRKYGRLVLREGWGTLPSFAEWLKQVPRWGNLSERTCDALFKVWNRQHEQERE